jgi:hypothetical protein
MLDHARFVPSTAAPLRDLERQPWLPGRSVRPLRYDTSDRRYIAGLMSDVPRKNGWTLAEHAGDRRPDAMQRLLNHANWDAFAAMTGESLRLPRDPWPSRLSSAIAGSTCRRSPDGGP